MTPKIFSVLVTAIYTAILLLVVNFSTLGIIFSAIGVAAMVVLSYNLALLIIKWKGLLPS